MITDGKIRWKAKKCGLMLRKDGHGGYLLVDPYTNALAAPGPMTLDKAALWLDDMEVEE